MLVTHICEFPLLLSLLLLLLVLLFLSVQLQCELVQNAMHRLKNIPSLYDFFQLG